MTKKIEEQLKTIEKENGIRILYACEAGSRCWGFASAASDYDVRYIYIRPLQDYLKVFPDRDTIESNLSEELDFSGWDLKKALALLYKSNCSISEWLRSTAAYRENPEFVEGLKRLEDLYASPEKWFYAYQGMAKGNYREYLKGDMVRIKKYLYVLRPILSCLWIKRFGTFPPVEFSKLCETMVPSGSELEKEIERLLELKRNGLGKELGPRFPKIDAVIEEGLALEMPLPERKGVSKEEMDRFFLKCVEKEAV